MNSILTWERRCSFFQRIVRKLFKGFIFHVTHVRIIQKFV